MRLMEDLRDHLHRHLHACHFRGEAVPKQMRRQVDAPACPVQDGFMQQEAQCGI